MMLRLFTRRTRKPDPYAVLSAEYLAAQTEFRAARERGDKRKMGEALKAQNRILPELLRMEIGR